MFRFARNCTPLCWQRPLLTAPAQVAPLRARHNRRFGRVSRESVTVRLDGAARGQAALLECSLGLGLDIYERTGRVRIGRRGTPHQTIVLALNEKGAALERAV